MNIDVQKLLNEYNAAVPVIDEFIREVLNKEGEIARLIDQIGGIDAMSGLQGALAVFVVKPDENPIAACNYNFLLALWLVSKKKEVN